MSILSPDGWDVVLCRGEVNMAEEFKRLDQKLVYHGTIIDYYRDTIQVRTGTSQNGILSGIRVRLRSFRCGRMESF